MTVELKVIQGHLQLFSKVHPQPPKENFNHVTATLNNSHLWKCCKYIRQKITTMH